MAAHKPKPRQKPLERNLPGLFCEEAFLQAQRIRLEKQPERVRCFDTVLCQQPLQRLYISRITTGSGVIRIGDGAACSHYKGCGHLTADLKLGKKTDPFRTLVAFEAVKTQIAHN